jgi:predicted  nucleic acid-binding Zn-ribbon protein
MERLKIITNIIISIFIGLLITSCEDASENANNLMYGNERSELAIKINNTIERIESKIDELENRHENANKETAEKINDQLQKLKDRRKELRADLRRLNDESDDTWENFKSDVEQAIDDIEEWINNIDIDFNNDAESINKE